MPRTISELLADIKKAIYGKDVRDAIHDSIKQCYTDVTTSKTVADDAATKAQTAAANANAIAAFD